MVGGQADQPERTEPKKSKNFSRKKRGNTREGIMTIRSKIAFATPAMSDAYEEELRGRGSSSRVRASESPAGVCKAVREFRIRWFRS